MTEEKGKTQKQAQGRLQASHMAGGVREGAEGCGEGSENQRADSEWALQSEEAAAVPGTPEKLSCFSHSLKWIPWNPPGTALTVGVEMLFSPLCSQQGPAQLQMTLHQAGVSNSPGSEPSKLSTCRADPGHIQTPILAGTQGRSPTAHPARAVPLTPILAQHLCPGVLSKAP